MTTYRYLPLQGPSDIRILYIDPATKYFDPLFGKLVHVSLDDDITYDALSYTWGSPELSSKITLDDGADLAITSNLAQALRRIRARLPPGEPTRIWADGICINQTDTRERNQQIRLMRRIYSQCQLGLVHLGEQADGSEKIPKFLNKLAPGVMSGKGAVTNYHDNPLLPDERDPGWQALRALFERPWFLRVWIIQEFALPREIRMMCGGWELDGDLVPLAMTLPTLNHSRQAMEGFRRAGESSDFVEGSDFVKAWAHQELVLRCRKGQGHSIEGGGTRFNELCGRAIDLLELLWRCRACNSTDPRDHYFALLSLAPDLAHEPTLAADYSKKLEDVAVDYGQYFIKSGLGLPILYSANDADVLDEALLSWLPNFTHSSIFKDKIWFLYEENLNSVSIDLGGPELRSLLVSGCVLDRVAVLGGEKDRLQGTSYWRGDWIQEIDSLVADIESYPTGQDVEEAVWRTIIADRSLDRQRPAPAYYYHSYLLCRKVGSGAFLLEGPSLEVIEAVRDTEHFDMAVAMLATSRFCVTKDGLFGMVPRNTRPGDMIFTMQGDEQRAMFVVRKDEARESYRWVGHAYVHDIWSVREYNGLAWEVINVD